MVRVEHCPGVMCEMYLQESLQSISLCVDCGSNQFVCNLLHCHRFVVLSDDGLVQVAWIQTYHSLLCLAWETSLMRHRVLIPLAL